MRVVDVLPFACSKCKGRVTVTTLALDADDAQWYLLGQCDDCANTNGIPLNELVTDMKRRAN